ncbi:MAG: hypothetical protein Q9168_002650 [Polycauliona sp. 1 TL-2023]
MDYSQQFFAQHEEPVLDIYQQQHFQPSLVPFNEDNYGPVLEHIQSPHVISTHPIHRPVIPSLEEAAEAEDTSIRPRLTQEQIAVLEDNFKSKPKPGTDFKKHLASRIGLSLQRVNNWYQNRRAKARHQRPQERRFDVLPHESSALWSTTDLVFHDYTNDVLDVSPQTSPPDLQTPAVDYISIPRSNGTPCQTANFHTELDMFQDYLDSAGANSDISPIANIPQSLSAQNANSLAMTRMSVPQAHDWSVHWANEGKTRPDFPDAGLATLQASQNAFPQAMYQSSTEGYHVGNFSCQTFASNSSSDGEQAGLMTPPPRTSPLPFPPQELFDRRQSLTADLTSDFNTIQLRPSQSCMGFSNEPTEVPALSASQTPDGTPPAPPQLHIDASMMHPELQSDLAVHDSNTPRLDIASRRKRPRPAALRPEAQRSVSYGPMTLSPTARIPSIGLGKMGSVRRIKSTGNGLNVGNGRVQKPGAGPAPMSPRNFHSLSSNDFLNQTAHITHTSSRNISPLTPLSPVAMGPQDQAWSGHWAHDEDSATPTAFDAEAHITSPPITPHDTLIQPSFASVVPHFYHWPPQSAPPQQTTFVDSPPMPPTQFSYVNWQQAPASGSLQGYHEEPSQQIMRPPLNPNYGYLDLQTVPSQHHAYQQMVFYQPPFVGSSPPQKEIEIQVQVIPAPEGLPQSRKTYTFNHTTPQDFSNAESTSSKVAGTTDPNTV